MPGYTKWLTAITTNQAIGNRLGGILGPLPGDGEMFTRGMPCYAPGTTFSPIPGDPLGRKQASAAPIAWAVALPVKVTLAPVIEEFRDGGYPAPLLAAGMTEAEIDAARAAIALEIGDRDITEPHYKAFIESHGYVLAF